MKFACWGDSLTYRDHGYALRLGLAYTPNRNVLDFGVGGENVGQVAARMLADTLYNDRVVIIWSYYGNNTGFTNAQYLAYIDSMVKHVSSGKFIVISDINRTDGSQDVGSAYRTNMIARNAAMAAAYGNNFLDVVSVLDNPTTRDDNLHLTIPSEAPGTDANTTILIPAIQSKLVALGYMNVTS